MNDLSGEVVRVLAERRAALDEDARRCERTTMMSGMRLGSDPLAASVVERRALYDGYGIITERLSRLLGSPNGTEHVIAVVILDDIATALGISDPNG